MYNLSENKIGKKYSINIFLLRSTANIRLIAILINTFVLWFIRDSLKQVLYWKRNI